jgi:hypothetical protein
LEKQNISFFRLFYWSKVNHSDHLAPLWRRVVHTVRKLSLGVSDDWNQYSDEELLIISYYLPSILPPELLEKMVKRIRPDLFRLQICLLRDVLYFSRHETPHLQFIDIDMGLRRRLATLFPDTPLERYGKIDPNYYTYARSTLNGLRKLWPEI